MRQFRYSSFLLLSLLASTGTARAQSATVTGVVGARFHVNDLAKAREFYTVVFGLQEKGGAGEGVAAFPIGTDQFVEFTTAESGSGQAGPLEVLILGTSDKPGASIKDQDGHRLEFVQRRKEPGTPRPDSEKTSLSNHLLHVGLGTSDLNRAVDFYGARFGCKEIFRGPTPENFRLVILRVPGPREDWVEFLLPTPQGAPDHLCLEVSDIQQAYNRLLERGATTRGKPRIASNGHWVINLADPNGIRVELMEGRPAAR